jgi:hypothetical protein
LPAKEGKGGLFQEELVDREGATAFDFVCRNGGLCCVKGGETFGNHHRLWKNGLCMARADEEGAEREDGEEVEMNGHERVGSKAVLERGAFKAIREIVFGRG